MRGKREYTHGARACRQSGRWGVEGGRETAIWAVRWGGTWGGCTVPSVTAARRRPERLWEKLNEDMQEYLRFRPVLLRLHVRPEPTYSGRTIAATFVHCARATGTCEGSKRG